MQPQNQPGTPVSPPSPAPQPPQAPQQTPQPQQPAPQPQPVPAPPQAAPQPVNQSPQVAQPQPPQAPEPVAPQEVLGSVAVADQVESGYGFENQTDEPFEESEIDLSQPVTWQAKEYIHQEKDAKWFIGFAVVLLAFLAVSIFLMKSISFSILLVVIAIVIIVLAKRPPRVMSYSLSEEGLHIDNTLHRYADFKSFGVIRDGEEFSVMLIPRRRFQPGITVYFPEESGEDIVDVLGSRMPMRDLRLDAVDKLVRKLRL